MNTAMRIAAGVVALLFLTTACTREPEADMAPMTDAAAEQIVESYADETLRLSGWSGYSQASLSPAPCEGRDGERSDDIYAMQGAYQLLVPGPDQRALIDRVRDGWRSLGYTIVSERTFGPDKGGQIHATNPADGVSMILGTGEIPALSLLIHTGCYQRIEPS